MKKTGLIRAIKMASAIATAVVTLFGLYQLLSHVNKITDSHVITSITFAVLFALCMLPFFYHFSRSRILAAYGLTKPSTERIVLLQRVTVNIGVNDEVGPDVRAELQWHTEYVFFDKPTNDDLVDCYYVDPSLSLENFRYKSTDAQEVERKFIDKNRIAVYWRPKNSPIIPYTRYVHEEKAIPPMSYAHPAFFQSMQVLCPTGCVEVMVSTCIPVEDAVIYPRPRMRKIADDLSFMEYAVNYQKSLGEVHISADGMQLKAAIENPKPGNDYLCMVFVKGGREEWRSRLKAEGWLARQIRKAKDINWRQRM